MFLEQFNKHMHLPKEKRKYELKSERTGPALNVNITKKSNFHNIPCVGKAIKEPQVVLDADFTLALQCPKFPRDGMCKFSFGKNFDVVNNFFPKF